MNALIFTLAGSLSLLAAIFLGKFFKIGPLGRSATQHFAAGIVFAAVCRELLPKVMLYHQPLDLAIGFILGVIAMIAAGRITSKMLPGVAIDLWIDGLLISVAFMAGEQTGILIAIALAIEALFLGLSIASSCTLMQSIGIALMLPFGLICGMQTVPRLPEAFFIGTLAFGIAALLYLVTEELLTEAHEIPDRPWITSLFFAGFLLILLIP